MQTSAKRTPAARRARAAAVARERPEGTRNRILEAALTAFADRGFDGATTRDISDAAGVNQGLITYHFASKEDLWKAAVDHIFGQMRVSFAGPMQMLADVDPVTRLRLMIRQFVRFSAAHPELHRLMVQEGRSDSARHRWLIERHVRPLFDGMVANIERVQKEGLFAGVPAAHLAYIYIGAAAHIFAVAPEFRRLAGEDPMKPKNIEAHADALVELLLGRKSK